jgi:hypothetical protein
MPKEKLRDSAPDVIQACNDQEMLRGPLRQRWEYDYSLLNNSYFSMSTEDGKDSSYETYISNASSVYGNKIIDMLMKSDLRFSNPSST